MREGRSGWTERAIALREILDRMKRYRVNWKKWEGLAERNGKMRDFYEKISGWAYFLIIVGLLYAGNVAYKKGRTGYFALCLSLALFVSCFWLFSIWKPLAGILA